MGEEPQGRPWITKVVFLTKKIVMWKTAFVKGASFLFRGVATKLVLRRNAFWWGNSLCLFRGLQEFHKGLGMTPRDSKKEWLWPLQVFSLQTTPMVPSLNHSFPLKTRTKRIGIPEQSPYKGKVIGVVSLYWGNHGSIVSENLHLSMRFPSKSC